MTRSITEIYFHAASLQPIITAIDPTIKVRPDGLITAYAWSEDVKYDEIGIQLPFRPKNRFDRNKHEKLNLSGLISIPIGHIAATFTYEIEGPELENFTKKIGFDMQLVTTPDANPR